MHIVFDETRLETKTQEISKPPEIQLTDTRTGTDAVNSEPPRE